MVFLCTTIPGNCSRANLPFRLRLQYRPIRFILTALGIPQENRYAH
ncbi:hypothetical protein QWZ13_18880 [Reinekea marina]|nr:hypothetical protein [Reinekea marina]MDN3650978.1 hypothetical protein [Reinekea marina]